MTTLIIETFKETAPLVPTANSSDVTQVTEAEQVVDRAIMSIWDQRTVEISAKDTHARSQGGKTIYKFDPNVDTDDFIEVINPSYEQRTSRFKNPNVWNAKWSSVCKWHEEYDADKPNKPKRVLFSNQAKIATIENEPVKQEVSSKENYINDPSYWALRRGKRNQKEAVQKALELHKELQATSSDTQTQIGNTDEIDPLCQSAKKSAPYQLLKHIVILLVVIGLIVAAWQLVAFFGVTYAAVKISLIVASVLSGIFATRELLSKIPEAYDNYDHVNSRDYGRSISDILWTQRNFPHLLNT